MKLKKQLIAIAITIVLLPLGLSVPIYRAFTEYTTASDDVEESSLITSKIYTRRLIADDYIADKSERAIVQWYSLQDDLEQKLMSDAIRVHSEEERVLLSQIQKNLAASRSIFGRLLALDSSEANSENTASQEQFISDQLTVTAQETIQDVQDLYTLNRNSADDAFQTIVYLLLSASVFYLVILALCFYILWRNAGILEKIDKMKSEFISLASHQLKTPLTSMRWYSELLMHDYGGSLNKEQTEYLATIYRSVLNMNDLVNTLLNISRIESGRIMIRPKLTDISELIDGVIHELLPKATEKKQKLIVNIDRDVPKCMVDEGLLRQIYLNLLSNAVKYSPEARDITVSVKRSGNSLLTSVADKGYGIPRKDRDRVFQKFYRGENIQKIGEDGTGLGLYLIKTIIDTFGGTIWFDTTEGAGTTFYFTVPLTGMKEKKGEVGLS